VAKVDVFEGLDMRDFTWDNDDDDELPETGVDPTKGAIKPDPTPGSPKIGVESAT
jgi:hypothetical protein